MEKRKAAFHNLGCKVNAYETEAMQQLLEKAGYEIVPFAPGADVYVINTCTVTNMADRKSRQMLHKAKKMNPHAIVVAAGCYVQAAGTELEEDSAIDIIIGNNRKKDLVSILEHYERSAVQESLIDINHTKEYEKLSLEKTVEHTRAYLKVQDGCNQFCRLHHSLCERSCTQPQKRRGRRGSKNAGRQWMQRGGSYRYPFEFLRDRSWQHTAGTDPRSA